MAMVTPVAALHALAVMAHVTGAFGRIGATLATRPTKTNHR
jgi:hypothetical protein